MLCPKCSSKILMLFTSVVCERCEADPGHGDGWHYAFANVLASFAHALDNLTCSRVVATTEDAREVRHRYGLASCLSVKLSSPKPFVVSTPDQCGDHDPFCTYVWTTNRNLAGQPANTVRGRWPGTYVYVELA